MKNCTHRCPKSGHFLSKLGQYFTFFEKGQGRPPPLPPLVTRLIFTPQLLIYYIQYENRKSRLEQMPEAATWGVLRKKVFFKMSQNSQETPVPEETPVNFAKFLKTPLLQNNSRRVLLKCGHFNNEARDTDCICCRELDALLYCFG